MPAPSAPGRSPGTEKIHFLLLRGTLPRVHDAVCYPLSSSVLIRVHPWLNGLVLLAYFVGKGRFIILLGAEGGNIRGSGRFILPIKSAVGIIGRIALGFWVSILKGFWVGQRGPLEPPFSLIF